MANEIRFPIATDKNSHRLVNAKDVLNGLACNCYCFECKQDLIAVNQERKQRAHFRHQKDSNCKMNYETFIHWVTKEVFKTLSSIKLPPVYLLDIKGTGYSQFRKRISEFLSSNDISIEGLDDADFNLPRKIFTTGLLLQNTFEAKIDSYLIEF